MDDRTIPDMGYLGAVDPNVPPQSCQRMMEKPYGFAMCRAPGRFVSNSMLVRYQAFLCDDHLMESATGRERARMRFDA